MHPSNKRYSLQQSIFRTTLAVALLWVIQSAGVLFGWPLGYLGIVPLEPVRLYGILTAPLVHSGYEHLFNNTLPLLVLGSALMYGYPRTRFYVLTAAWLTSGIGVWLLGRDATHLGASGVAHGLFFYLFVVAILRRDGRSVGLMMIAFFMYGTMILTIFPTEPQISFEAHLFGALGGAACAFAGWRHDPKPRRKKYAWENLDEPDDPALHEKLRRRDDQSTSDWQPPEPPP